MKIPVRQLVWWGMVAGLTSCHPAAPANRSAAGKPDRLTDRIVSIDYCADQMLLGLVDRSRIAAVSVDVESDPDFSAPLAGGLPRVRADVERVLALRPTLVVRSYGGGPRMESALKRAGIRVFTLPYSDTLPAIRSAIRASGNALAVPGAASRRIAQLDSAIPTIVSSSKGTALYITPGDVTTGPDSLIAGIMQAAGYASYEQRPGWHRLPVEQLVATPPNLVVRGFFDSPAHRQDRWSSSGHTVLTSALAGVRHVDVPGSEIACGNWLVGNAIRRLSGKTDYL